MEATAFPVALDPCPANRIYGNRLETSMPGGQKQVITGTIDWIFTPVPNRFWIPKPKITVVRNQPVRKSRAKRHGR